MLPEPEPTKELFVKRCAGLDNVVDIYTYSADAEVFCERLGKYGNLQEDANSKDKRAKKYTLIIYPSFNYEELISYIESYNN